ncbi:zf-TFIIB domain-containing protein [bacterium]|nr:zf-TFIIB domain-containing protein [bacterium]
MRDTKETLICPACGKEMKKVFIKSAGINLDICLDGCGGILFDNQELKHFDEIHEDISEIQELYEGKTFEKVDLTKKRTCPICDSGMVRNHASHMQEIEIDECYSCGAIFLDYGELKAIRNQFKTEEDRKEAFIKYFQNKHNAYGLDNYKLQDSNKYMRKQYGFLISSIANSIMRGLD